MTDAANEYDEVILPDDYPVHAGYAYVIDGVPRSSDVSGNVASLKRHYHASEVRNYNFSLRAKDHD